VKLDGTATLSAPPAEVWAAITDPAVLARTIPGCQGLERTGEDEYAMTVSVGVGAIRGVYAGEVKLTDKQEPTRYVMHASGSGGPGSVRATVPITLEAVDGGTKLTYDADAVTADLGPLVELAQLQLSHLDRAAQPGLHQSPLGVGHP
ncbi:Carbon monoxide dehydrogenase subunit G, partial [Klenkia terrae]